MLLIELRKKVCQANLDLVKFKLVILTWGNVSGIDRKSNLVVIKPSGIDYEKLTYDKMVIVDLKTGKIVEGSLSPSSDTPTHLEIYKAFKNVSTVVHTHSQWATILSQNMCSIDCAGTTHADYFYGTIPCTRNLTRNEIINDYEFNTGRLIVSTFQNKKINYENIPAVLVSHHGPFVWGKSTNEAVHNAVVLEYVAKMYYFNLSLVKRRKIKIDNVLLDKHFLRKHGKNAYYGQR